VTEPAWSTMIDAQPVNFPVHCPRLSAAVLYYDAPVPAMRTWVEGTGLRLLERAPGRTEVAVSVTRYAGSAWGTYDALDVVLDVVPEGDADDTAAGLLFLDTVVNQRFTTEVSYWVLGIGRRYGTITTTHGPDTVAFRIAEDGEKLVSIELPRQPTSTSHSHWAADVYTHLGGVLHVTPIGFDLPDRTPVTDGVRIDVGAGRLGGLLRDVGLPGAPTAYAWAEHLTCTIHEPLRISRRGG
jgi:hypothetical protein